MLQRLVKPQLRFRVLMLVLIGAAFAISVTQLSAFPVLHSDEAWTLQPGYTFWSEGHFAAPMFTGYNGMSQLYLEFMPLYSLLEGGFVKLAGFGPYQARFFNVLVGIFGVALVYAVARRIANPRAGFVAALLLVTWQWIPEGSHPQVGSGIVWLDMLRIARYDVLAAVFALLALHCLLHVLRMQRLASPLTSGNRGLFLSGIASGLAGLSHIYGLFSAPAIVLTWLVSQWVSPHLNERRRSASQLLFPLLAFVAGFILAFGPWAVLVVSHWDLQLAQSQHNAARFDLTHAQFYLQNLLLEPGRFSLDVRSGAPLKLIGYWALVLGLPSAWVVVAVQAWRTRSASLAAVASFIILVEVQFALLISVKPFLYLPTAASQFSILASLGLGLIWSKARMSLRIAATVLVVLVAGRGVIALSQMLVSAQRQLPAEITLQAVRRAIPRGSVVLAWPDYWFALNPDPFRAYQLLILQTEFGNAGPLVSAEQAFQQMRPRFLIIDARVRAQMSPCIGPWVCALERELMSGHLRPYAQLSDSQSNPLTIYEWLDGDDDHTNHQQPSPAARP